MTRPIDVDPATRLDGLDRPLERLAGALDEQAGLLVDVAGEERRVGVAVDAVEVRRDVDVDDVAVLEHPRVGDAVADHLVDAGAQRLREALVAEGRRVGAVVAEELVADPVELVGGDARRDVRADELARLRGQPAGDPHLRDGLGVLDLVAGERRGRRPVDVLRSRDRRRAPGDAARSRPGRSRSRSCGRVYGGGRAATRRRLLAMAKYWFCVKHHAVEGPDGAARRSTGSGPIATEAEAARALEKAQERNEEWDNDPNWSDEPGWDGQSKRRTAE